MNRRIKTRRNLLGDKRSMEDDRFLPMINVAFLLLIFFMLAGHLVYFDPLSVEPPISQSGVEENSRELIITMSSDGRIAIRDKIITFSEVRAAIEDELNASQLEEVRLKADNDLDAVVLVEMMEQLAALGISKVRLLTTAE